MFKVVSPVKGRVSLPWDTQSNLQEFDPLLPRYDEVLNL